MSVPASAWIEWGWLKINRAVCKSVCDVIGHRLRWYHPQQAATECRRCKWIIDRDGEVASGPL